MPDPIRPPDFLSVRRAAATGARYPNVPPPRTAIGPADTSGDTRALARPGARRVGRALKHQIVAAPGVKAGAPLDCTWSCYTDGKVHCGVCGPCFMRRVAFEMDGRVDPVPFAAP